MHNKTIRSKLMQTSYERPILFFDGYCAVCNTSVQFVLRHEKSDVLLFCALQSALAQELIHKQNPRLAQIDSLIFYANKRWYTHSSAALKLVPYLRWYWQWLRVLWIFPAILRNTVYNFVARNRYRWFPRQQTCTIPPKSAVPRFIE